MNQPEKLQMAQVIDAKSLQHHGNDARRHQRAAAADIGGRHQFDQIETGQGRAIRGRFDDLN